ncbi:uncharacterized protein LOC133180499 [Saccostrea echinata]|uniref:uncharacterized protein LOC133180499 n=1 Tax=Saccostrea echinata TaxID=191078 RepID=UPI002A7F610F|nr:uncharacterized protein LOC133180499 [Saccostrea echinata]
MGVKALILILIFSIPALQAYAYTIELEEKRTSIFSRMCRWVIRGGLMATIATFVKSVVLPTVGITSGGLAAGSLVEKFYNILAKTKGLIVTKEGYVDDFLHNFLEFHNPGMVYTFIEPYLDLFASSICD